MERLLDQIRPNLLSSTEVERKAFLKRLRDLVYSLESSDDTVNRMYATVQCNNACFNSKLITSGYSVIATSLIYNFVAGKLTMIQALQISVARIAIDLKIFEILSASSEPINHQALQDITGADSLLLRITLNS